MMYLSQPSFWQKRSRAFPIFLMLALCLFSTGIILFSTSRARAASITGSINWSATTGQSANLQYGLNAFHGYDPTPQMDPTYRSNVAAMKAGIVRWHYGSQMADSSTDSMAWVVSPTTSSYHWDTNKINSALSNALQSGGAFAYGPVKVMDIVNWPAYLDDGSEHLLSSQYSAYANFCAQLVRIININGHYGFKYFELFNERENGTGAPYDHNMAELGRIYNQAAAAMKAVDPTIKVGGPAFARPDLTYNIDDFFSTAAPNLDFVSYHSYATGNSSDTNQQVWNNADIGNFTTSIRAEYAKYSSRSIDYFHDEYNISWNPPDDKMTNEVGGVFDALAMTSLVNHGATGGMAWNEADGWYGKLDNSYARRPASYLYQYLNEDMKGNVVSSSSSDSTKIVMLAVKNGNKDAFMLINRSGASQTIQLSFTGFSSAITSSTKVTTKQMSASGGNISSTTIGALTSGSGYSMPADTVTVFSLTDAGGSGSTPTPTPSGGTTTSYEAEASVNTLSGGASVITCSTCSGGQRVGYLVAGASLRFNNISASSTGAATITIYYTNGNSSAMTTQVSANGGASLTVNYPSTGGWDTVGSVTVSLTLQAGSSNSILISNPSAAQPDIDCITVQQ